MSNYPRASVYPSAGARPSMAPGASVSGPGAAAGMGAGAPPGGGAATITEQMSQIDQAITLTLQEIDENFAKSHQIITGRILPAVKRYGESSYRISHATRFWRFFFETAAQVTLDISPDDGSQYDQASFERSSEASPTERRHQRTSSGGEMGELRRSAGRADESNASLDLDDSMANDSLYQSMRNARASSPPRAHNDEPKWADIESPFERAKRDIQRQMQAQGRVDNAVEGASAAQNKRGAGQGGAAGRDLAKGIAKLGFDPDETSSDIATPPQISSRAAAGRGLRDAVLRNKIQATPQGGKGAARNPFSTRDGNQGMASTPGGKPGGWNGIADLRKTPLNTNDRRRALQGGEADSSMGSYAHGFDHSPPVTMQFSIPRSKYLQTPAKEAARMVVDDLLKTAGGTRISPRTAFKQRQALRAGDAAPHPLGSARSTAKATGIIGTPLKTGMLRAEAKQRRDSLPTPPTTTKQIGGRASQVPAPFDDGSPAPSAGQASAPPTGGSRASRLMDEDEGGVEALDGSKAANYDYDDDEDDDDDDDDDDDEDEDDDDRGFAPPIPAPHLGSMDPSLSTVASSFSGAAAQSLRDDTIFGSKIGANPFTRAGSASASSKSASTSASGSGPTMPNFRPLGNIEDMGTVYDAHALAGQDKSNTWSAESPSKSRQS